jgi:hypothetical protein
MYRSSFKATVTAMSSATLAGKAGFGVNINASSKVAVATTAGRWCQGVLGEQDVPAAADLPAEVITGGFAVAIAGGTVTGGDSVTLDSAGEFVLATAGQEAMGRVVGHQNDSYANGAYFPLWLDRHIAQPATVAAMTIGTESTNVIEISFQGPAEVAQYRLTLYTTAMLPALVGAFTIADGGAGALVTASAKPSCLFTTTAAGLAELDVTDVAGGSGLTCIAVIEPMPDSGKVPSMPGPIESTLTFD